VDPHPRRAAVAEGLFSFDFLALAQDNFFRSQALDLLCWYLVLFSFCGSPFLASPWMTFPFLFRGEGHSFFPTSFTSQVRLERLFPRVTCFRGSPALFCQSTPSSSPTRSTRDFAPCFPSVYLMHLSRVRPFFLPPNVPLRARVSDLRRACVGAFC